MKKKIIILIFTILILGCIAFITFNNIDNINYIITMKCIRKDIVIGYYTSDIQAIGTIENEIYVDLNNNKAYHIVAEFYPENTEGKKNYRIKEKKTIELNQQIVDDLISVLEDPNYIEEKVSPFTSDFHYIKYNNDQLYIKSKIIEPIIDSILNLK